MRLVFWQNMLAIHQSSYIRALAAMGHAVTLVVEQELAEDRRSLGYCVPDFGSTRVIVAPDERQIADLAEFQASESVHIIAGLRGYRLGAQAFRTCRASGARMVLFCEGGDPRGVKGLMRRAAYAAQAMRPERSFAAVLAMGSNGVHWYRTCGWPSAKLFPYAYITETPESASQKRTTEVRDEVRIVFLGQLIHRKGVDILLRALGQVEEAHWRLLLVGDGPGRAEYQQLARQVGVADRTQFVGVLPNREALSLVADCDLLVLPSRFDGWGAVVNEALMRGVPVVCSDRCGASDLLDDRLRGEVFRAGSVSALADVLGRWIAAGRLMAEHSGQIRDWAKSIEGPTAATYFLAVLAHVFQNAPRPVPPWYGASQSNGV